MAECNLFVILLAEKHPYNVCTIISAINLKIGDKLGSVFHPNKDSLGFVKIW